MWLSLVPIIGGVALATVKELSFAWAALLGAIVSDLALALRNVLSKVVVVVVNLYVARYVVSAVVVVM